MLMTTICLGALRAQNPASVVTQVLESQLLFLVSQDRSKPWRVDDQVCVMRESEPIGCGIVVLANTTFARVKLTEQKRVVRLADQVVSFDMDRHLASLAALEERNNSVAPYKFNMTGGLTSNFGSFIYFVHFQGFITPYIALGFQPSMLRTANDVQTMSTLGGLFTFNYYGSGHYRGLWIHGASGLFALPTTSGSFSETIYSPALVGTVGWRATWALGFNIGLAAGFHYIPQSRDVRVQVPFSSFAPIFTADIGFNF